MAWTYADWEEQATAADRLTRLRQWRTELRNAISLEVDSTGNRVSSVQIRQALADTAGDLARLEAQVASETSSRPVAIATVTRGRA